MATDIDTNVNTASNSDVMLKGQRWNDVDLLEANKTYMFPRDQWEASIGGGNDVADKLIQIAKPFIDHHYSKQLPRLQELERYYRGDNDIHYAWTDKASNKADNRIASGYPKYITDIKVGHSVGNPIKFQYSDISEDSDQALIGEVDSFNDRNDEPYHEKIMKKNLSVTGRAYELEYVNASGTDSGFMSNDQNELEAMIKPIDPTNAFVVYDTGIEQHSLFAVRYFMVDFLKSKKYYIEIYTTDYIYYYTADSSPTRNIKFVNQGELYFGAVPITEYANNDERMGDWEGALDKIDAIDKSLSEMANSQEDFSNAMMNISGDFRLADENGKVIDDDELPVINARARMIFTNPSVLNSDSLGGSPTVIPTTVGYVTKETNVDEWKTYINLLASQIHKDTNTPDTSDQNFSNNASGVAMSYKLWGQDQERAIQQSLYSRGLMRRLRLLANYLKLKNNLVKAPEDIENFSIIYTPNLPKNDDEIIQTITGLNNTGAFSQQTLRELAEAITGIDAETEAQRFSDEDDDQLKNDPLQQVIKPQENQPPIQYTAGSPLNQNAQGTDDHGSLTDALKNLKSQGG